MLGKRAGSPLESLGQTQVATFAIKQLTNRERPLDHDRLGGFWEVGTYFPSGHAASAFAEAKVFAYRYRDHIAVPITAYSLASLVAVPIGGAWFSSGRLESIQSIPFVEEAVRSVPPST